VFVQKIFGVITKLLDAATDLCAIGEGMGIATSSAGLM